MKNVTRWIALGLVLCSIPAAAENPRKQDRWTDRGKPVYVDGVEYKRSELGQFKDSPELYWVIEADGVYGFTTAEGVKEYGEQHAKPARPEGPRPLVETLVAGPTCSGFNKNVGCGGVDWLSLCTPSSIPYISDSWNDVISCVETGSSVGKYTVLYKCYYYDVGSGPGANCWHAIWIGPGGLVTDLNAYQMNNITSSIRFCSNVDPFSCT